MFDNVSATITEHDHTKHTQAVRGFDEQLAQSGVCQCVVVHTWSAMSARLKAEWDDCTPTQLAIDCSG